MVTDNNLQDMKQLKSRYYRWYPPTNHLGYQDESTHINPKNTALLLVDVYLPDEASQENKTLGKPSALAPKDYRAWRNILESKIAPLVQAARSVGFPIIYTCNSSPHMEMSNSAYGEKLTKSLGFLPEKEFGFFQPESPDNLLNFLECVRPQKGDFLVYKTVYSAFHNTILDDILRNLGIATLLVAGFRLDACLLSTVFDALFHNYRLILFRDATLGCELASEIDSMEFTNRMLLHFETLIGSTAKSDDFLDICHFRD